MESQTQKPKIQLWSQILAPVAALSIICLVASFLLGITNRMTAPLIAENTAREAQVARQILLPEADSFEAISITEAVPGTTALYSAANGAGFIVEAYGRGYGGAIPVMVAFLPDGTIAGVTFLKNNETPGLGKKLETDLDFAAQFGRLAAQPLAMGDIDKIASSTISSSGALSAINAAITLYTQEIHNLEVDDVAAASNNSQEGGEAQ